MSIYTEEIAKTKLCPRTFQLVPVQSVGGVSMQLVFVNCQGSACMLWREGRRFGMVPAPNQELEGYCGMGNGPRDIGNWQRG